MERSTPIPTREDREQSARLPVRDRLLYRAWLVCRKRPMITLTTIAIIVAAISAVLRANRPFFASLAVIAVVACVRWLP